MQESLLKSQWVTKITMQTFSPFGNCKQEAQNKDCKDIYNVTKGFYLTYMRMLYLLFYLSKTPEKSITVSTKHIEHIKQILTVIIIINGHNKKNDP